MGAHRSSPPPLNLTASSVPDTTPLPGISLEWVFPAFASLSSSRVPHEAKVGEECKHKGKASPEMPIFLIPSSQALTSCPAPAAMVPRRVAWPPGIKNDGCPA